MLSLRLGIILLRRHQDGKFEFSTALSCLGHGLSQWALEKSRQPLGGYSFTLEGCQKAPVLQLVQQLTDSLLAVVPLQGNILDRLVDGRTPLGWSQALFFCHKPGAVNDSALSPNSLDQLPGLLRRLLILGTTLDLGRCQLRRHIGANHLRVGPS